MVGDRRFPRIKIMCMIPLYLLVLPLLFIQFQTNRIRSVQKAAKKYPIKCCVVSLCSGCAHRIKMASETGTSIVSNERCDVNNTIQQVFEPLRRETTNVKVPRIAWNSVIKETNEFSNNLALHSIRTPTIFSTASSFSANTEGKELQRNVNFMTSSGDVEERTTYKLAINTALHIPSLEPHSMPNNRNDIDNVTCLTEQLNGNIFSIM